MLPVAVTAIAMLGVPGRIVRAECRWSVGRQRQRRRLAECGFCRCGHVRLSGIPSGPASPGGLNNAAEDPSGAANASKPAPGTNNAGTAQSSGSGANTGAGVTTGSAGSLGTGTAATPNTSSDAAINEENKTIDRKVKSICRGC